VELAAHPNIAGIKESSADLAKVQSLIAAVPATFPVLVGSSAKFHDCLGLGAAGGILAIANAAPRSARSIFERFSAGDVMGSRSVQCSIGDGASVAMRFGIQGLKYAMDLKGFHGGPGRPPLLPLDAQQKADVQALFQSVGA
jgi:4-hydroxy-2-oxoglutarate aldolase